MSNPVAHFEIYGDDPQKLAGFNGGMMKRPMPEARQWLN